MENPSVGGPTSIMNLPDDCLYFVFKRLVCGPDRESFGLTCHRWLNIQNTCRRSLQLDWSLASQTFPSVHSFHLHRLLTRFYNLQSLSLSGCLELTDSGLTLLQYSGSNLRSLYLDCCLGITDSGLSLIASGCPCLTVISLHLCNVTDIGLETLAKFCLALKDVNLSNCSLITDHGIRALSQHSSQLRAVRISYCGNINGIGFKGCSQTLSYLEAESCKLEPKGISGIVSGGGLEYLNVSSLSFCTENDLREIGAGLATRLRVLNLRMCRTVSDESIAAISKGCPLLQEWNLALCHEVRVSGWESIGLNCYNLERLHVNRCRNLCDLGLQALRDGCKRLSVLYLSRARRISSTSIEMFKLLRGDVEIREEEVVCIAPNWVFSDDTGKGPFDGLNYRRH